MKNKLLKLAFSLMLVTVAATADPLYYVRGNAYEDYSWRFYNVYAGGEVECRYGAVTYGPSWCTSAGNCLARAASFPIPTCASLNIHPGPWTQEP